MTWMRSFTGLGLTVGFVVIGLGGAGCGPDPKEQKISELTAERDELRRDLSERERQLNNALVREEDARKAIDDLNVELADIRAEGSKMPDADGWIAGSGFDMISIPGSVLFASGKADLTKSGKKTLDKISSDIRMRYPDRDVYVFGHSDDEPIRKSKWRDNWELSAHRALQVVRHLAGAGISPENLIQASCAEYRPRTPNSNSDARRQNRRVEFYAVERTLGATRTTAARTYGD